MLFLKSIFNVRVILIFAITSVFVTCLNAMTKKSFPKSGEFLQYVMNEKHSKVKYLLENNLVNINMTDSLGQTALILAVRGEDTKMVKILLQYGADFSVRDNSGKTVFDYLKEIEDKEIIELINSKRTEKSRLPKKSKDSLKIQELKKKLAQEPNDISFSNNILKDAIKSKDIEALKFLIFYYEDNYGLTVDSKIEMYAPRKRKNVKLVSGEDLSYLMQIFKDYIEKDNEQGMRDLIKLGADVNYNFGKKEGTPLDLALNGVTWGHSTDIIKLLMDFGADPSLSGLENKLLREYNWREEFDEIEKILKENISVPVELLKKAEDVIREFIAKEELANISNWPKELSGLVCGYL